MARKLDPTQIFGFDGFWEHGYNKQARALGLFGAYYIWVPFGTHFIWGPFGFVWVHLGLFGSICVGLRLYRSVSAHLGLFEAVLGPGQALQARGQVQGNLSANSCMSMIR